MSATLYCGTVLLGTLRPTPTCTLTHLSARRGIRARYMQPVIVQSEVIVTILYLCIRDVHLHHCHHNHRVLALRSRHKMTSFRSGDCARESVKMCSCACTCMHGWKQTYICLHTQTRLLSHLGIMLLVLLISMSPNSCSGPCYQHMPNVLSSLHPEPISPKLWTRTPVQSTSFNAEKSIPSVFIA